jgi:hypothetical protein
MKAVAEPNQRQANNVMSHQLLEVLARLLHAQDQDNGLLGPVGRLEEVVELDDALVRLVREVLVHAARVVVPHRRPAHHVHARGAQDSEVQGCIRLLHEACLFPLALQPRAARQGTEELLHDELAREGEYHGVEGYEGDIPRPLSVLHWLRRVRVWQGVREEDEAVDGVAVGRV